MKIDSWTLIAQIIWVLLVQLYQLRFPLQLSMR